MQRRLAGLQRQSATVERPAGCVRVLPSRLGSECLLFEWSVKFDCVLVKRDVPADDLRGAVLQVDDRSKIDVLWASLRAPEDQCCNTKDSINSPLGSQR